MVESIRELVSVRPHPTVVRLEQARDAGASWITESFCRTKEIERHLDALHRTLAQPTGRGVFVIGHYGAGKSHLLAYLARGVEAGDLATPAPRVVTVSLVHFDARQRLEDIVGDAAGVADAARDRRVGWSELAARHPEGVLLVVDELSEFLRSKATREEFTEDVRFLQFLGEWATDHRLWIVASMQEQIEHTGQLESSLYRKIKDRYPLRLILSTAHVRELIADGILVKQPGYRPAVEALAAALRQALPDNPMDDAALCAVYPLHPATLELLEEVRDQFSAARGVVDFAVTRLAGDSARGVSPFLDRPWGELLTPDCIVEHFRDLLELQPEFLALAQTLLPYYEEGLARLFERPAQQALARRILHLLILVHLSPVRQSLTAAEAANMLLLSATRVDPDRNQAIAERLLARLSRDGRYVARTSGGGYRLDLAGDASAELERLLRREVAELQGAGDAVFEALAPLLGPDGFHPFAQERERWLPRTFRWSFHDRPYSLWVGSGQPPPTDGLGLCMRLPWGAPEPAAGAWTFVPEELDVDPATLELAALARLRGRPLPVDAQGRLRERTAAGVKVFESRVETAYRRGRLLDPRGAPEHVPPRPEQTRFAAQLEACADRMFRRTYPGFERYAPTHGPLPHEALRQFMRFAVEHDLGDDGGSEFVDVVREAYLVPLGLLRRAGRGYVIPGKLEKHELVAQLTALLDHRPAPRAVYDHLGRGMYGLVPDQVSALLVFLLAQGALDIVKGGRSYRELFETLPAPIAYDELVPGQELTLEEQRDLETVCSGLHIAALKQWTVFAQRRAVAALREQARREVVPLHECIQNLQERRTDASLCDRLQRLVSKWSAVQQGASEREGLQYFLHAIGSPGAFLRDVAELGGVSARAGALLPEVDRMQHLLGQMRIAPEEAAPVSPAPPGLEQPGALEGWLEQARERYRAHASDYRARHDAYWRGVAEHAIWSWAPPAVARSRHLRLGDDLRAVQECRSAAERLRCRGLVNLDFQPVCRCGFDGEVAPIREELTRFGRLRESIELAVRLFFGAHDVKARIREWHALGLGNRADTQAYLDGVAPAPVVEQVALLDEHLEGGHLVTELPVAPVVELLRERTWEPEALGDALRAWIAHQDARRLRFRGEPGSSVRPELAVWCVRHALGSGEPLPAGLSAEALAGAAREAQPEWVAPKALTCLDELGIGELAVARVLAWVAEDRVHPAADAAEVVRAARELCEPSVPSTPDELAALAARLYAHHDRLLQVARQASLRRLDEVARAPVQEPPPLLDALRARTDAQWLVIDCLGLPLASGVREALRECLPGWRIERAGFASVRVPTTTDGWYRSLAEAGVAHELVKIDVIDDLIHNRRLPLGDLIRIAVAELTAACRRVRTRLDAGGRLTVFADHGFRLSADGQRYEHGGGSTLERLVPLWDLAPG